MPDETPSPELIERMRAGQRGYETTRELFASQHTAWVLFRWIIGAHDGMPLRRRMASGDFGPEAASSKPGPDMGCKVCPLTCGFHADFTRCVCAGTADGICLDEKRSDPPPQAAVAAEERRARVAGQPSVDAANRGQPRSDGEEAGVGAATEEIEHLPATAPEPYFEPPKEGLPMPQANRNRPQEIRPAFRRSSKW